MNVLRRVMSFVKGDIELATGGTADVGSTTGKTDRVAHLTQDIWYLVIPHLDDRRDIYNLCLVSKDLYQLAIPSLYHTIQFGCEPYSSNHRQSSLDYEEREMEGGWHEHRWKVSLKLIRRLVENPDGQQAHAVRVLEITKPDLNPYRFGEEDEEEEEEEGTDDRTEEENAAHHENMFATLVQALPKLKLVRLHSQSSTSAPFQNLIPAVTGHINKPQLHLLGEQGFRPVTGPMPNVTALRATVMPWYPSASYEPDPGQPNRRIPQLQKLFFACPNLKSFDLSVFGNYGGCVQPAISRPLILSFQLTGKETFPPLESLALDGYRMEAEEWGHWRAGLDWSRLTSLTLGPQRSTAFLKRLTRSGVLSQSLRSLSVRCWETDGNDSCPELDKFLLSFGSLEGLVVKGHVVTRAAICNHPGLKRFHMHAIERERGGHQRPVMNAEDLIELDSKLPNLEELQIDIARDSNGWPNDVLEVLSSGFAHLQHLTLHSEVGLNFDWRAPRADNPLSLPKFNEDLAKEFAEPFFAGRGTSLLETLTIKTGECLRRFPQWHPAYDRDEKSATLTVRFRAPTYYDAWRVAEEKYLPPLS